MVWLSPSEHGGITGAYVLGWWALILSLRSGEGIGEGIPELVG